jgi:protein-S-isoprenylcysteine O-methyltransferase Ste14
MEHAARQCLVYGAVGQWERTMAKLFPAAYPPYKRVTKMLIPYLL